MIILAIGEDSMSTNDPVDSMSVSRGFHPPSQRTLRCKDVPSVEEVITDNASSSLPLRHYHFPSEGRRSTGTTSHVPLEFGRRQCAAPLGASADSCSVPGSSWQDAA
jgi:hypothetical protein